MNRAWKGGEMGLIWGVFGYIVHDLIEILWGCEVGGLDAWITAAGGEEWETSGGWKNVKIALIDKKFFLKPEKIVSLQNLA